MFGHRNDSEWFRIIPECWRGYRNPPGEVWALLGHEGRERAAPGGGARPPMRSPNWTRRGGAAPFPSPSPSPFLPPSPILVGLGKGSPTPTGRRTPPLWRAPLGPAGLPLAPLYTGAGGHPKTHKLILEIVP